MGMVFFGGTMDKFLKDNGRWEQKMVMESGQGLMEVIMKVNGI